MLYKRTVQSVILKTTRLLIIPLNEYNLRLSIEDWQKMERNLGLKLTDFKLEEIGTAMKECLQSVIADGKDYFWHTNWIIILKKESRIIGGTCFKGKPDVSGKVEIGYGIHEKYWNKGYATEAVSRMIKWAFTRNNVKAVIAETDKDNIASWRVLEKNGLQKLKEIGNSIWWKLEKV